MKLFVAALALLLIGVTCAIPEHRLSYPKFENQRTHLYDVWINITTGVPGLDPQVSKSVLNAELHIYAQSPTALIIRMQNVRVSGSIHSICSRTHPVNLKTDSELQKHLNEPTKVTLENGMVKHYTLGNDESLQSSKIKRAILRSLEVHIEGKVLQNPHEFRTPQHFNVSRSTPYGNYSSHYIVTSSPYSYFPSEKNVYNISRTDNFETIPYLAYHSHHNFEKQGCPGICNKNQGGTGYAAGCPSGYESYQTPVKKSFVQHHNLRLHKSGISVIDIVKTKETHVADVYDQNMEVSIESLIRLKEIKEDSIPEPTDQKVYETLDVDEINEEEIKQICKYPDAKEAYTAVQNLLKKITQIVLERNIETEQSKSIGEHLVMLQKALTILSKNDLKKIQDTITDWRSLKKASEEDKIKRQIWLENLPLIGTENAISFIAELIKENVNKPEKTISLWESKNFLEALPLNILYPTGHTVQTLISLTEILADREVKGYAMFCAASHMAVARVIHSLCAVNDRLPDEDSGIKNLHRLFENHRKKECPKQIVKKHITDIVTKLKTTTDSTKRVVYLEALSHMGLKTVLPHIATYVNRRISGLSPSSNDFVRSVAILSLHNIVAKYPTEVRNIVLPVYINKTEPPKLRIAAFGVFIRSYPSLGELQFVAEETWRENSLEVGSYVTKTLTVMGNSSDPCDEITARRIKKVMSQIKRFDVGQHHALNFFDSWFDGIRNFGLEHRYEMTPSNESFFPSTIYSAFGYNTDTLKDYIFKFGLNAQGFTSRNFHDAFLRLFNLKPSDDIPKVKIPEIFPEVDVVSRDPEFWRFTVYEKLFYINSYYYYDSKEHQTGDVFHLIKEHYLRYFTDESGKMSGHIVQVFLPSSYQTKAVPHALPYPVQFEMKNPLLLSWKFEIKPTTVEDSLGFSVDVSPSVYYSTLYTNQMLNLGDCKHIGVSYEKKLAATYPFKVILYVTTDSKLHLDYSFPELNKKIFTYTSEARTYAGKLTSEELPFIKEKSTIKTIPSQFKREERFGIPGLPLFEVKFLTEDIQFGKAKIPQTRPEVISMILQDFMNAGWRRKSVEIRRIPNSGFWNTDSKVELSLDPSREFKVSKREPKDEEGWLKQVNFLADETNYKKYGKDILERILTLSHIREELGIVVKYTLTKTLEYKTEIRLIHRHTLGGALHCTHINAKTLIPNLHTSLELNSYIPAAFIRRPNEFKYGDESYGKQLALILGYISLNNNETFDNPEFLFTAVGRYKSLEAKLNKDLHPPAPKRSFLPETHDDCVTDVRDGKPQSVHCLKAINERSIYNNWDVHVIWSEELPTLITDIAYQTDLFLKMSLYSHMTTYRKPSSPGLHIDLTYIDKLTDKPVFDIVLVKPTEVVKFEKVDAGWNQPISSLYSIPDRYIKHWTNTTYPPTCSFMDKYVRTYDMKTYHAPVQHGCSYILSTHCLEHKKFAIIAKILDLKRGTKEIYIHVGKHTIVLTPAQRGKFVVKFDDEDHDVHILQPIVFEEEELIYAVSNVAYDKSYLIEIHAENAGIIVTYDGRNVKTQVDLKYKGELCGLCSEFNGEIYREMRGPKRCLYTDSGDFTKSNLVGKCGDKTPKHPYICPNQYEYEWKKEHAPEEQEPIKRNIVVYEEDRICFSIHSLFVCERENSELNRRMITVEFHCLNRRDSVARKLVTESKRRVLAELETKSVDMRKEISIPTKCSS